MRLPVLMRLTFATRIGLIVFASVALVWLGAIALFVLSSAGDASRTGPLPRQIVAVVGLLERTRPEDRQSVLEATSSTLVAMRLEAGDQVDPPATHPRLKHSEQRLDHDLAALGGRRLSVAQPAGARRFLARFTSDALEWRIALKTAQTLVIDSRGAPLVTLFGLPVGFGAGLFGVVVALLALLIMHRETRPLARLAAEVDRIDLSTRAVPLTNPRRSAPEIRAMVEAFNRLQTRLALLLKARMAMLGGMSHDVRTFATRLRLRIDAIPETAQRERAIADIDDMIRLLDDALLTTRAGAGEFAHELVELDDVVRTEVADRLASGAKIGWRRSATGGAPAGIAPSTEPLPGPSMTVLGDRLALRRISANLIDNALKYGDRVEVGLMRDGGLIELTFDDDGPGIPADQRELMFEPFARLESSRNRGTGGAGLGLAIVRTLAEAHGGTAHVCGSPLGGARLVVRLPAFGH